MGLESSYGGSRERRSIVLKSISMHRAVATWLLGIEVSRYQAISDAWNRATKERRYRGFMGSRSMGGLGEWAYRFPDFMMPMNQGALVPRFQGFEANGWLGFEAATSLDRLRPRCRGKSVPISIGKWVCRFRFAELPIRIGIDSAWFRGISMPTWLGTDSAGYRHDLVSRDIDADMTGFRDASVPCSHGFEEAGNRDRWVSRFRLIKIAWSGR